MSVEENKELVRRLIEECGNQRKPGITEEILSLDYVAHAASGEEWTLDNYQERVVPESFPMVKDTILHLLGEGELVFARIKRSVIFTSREKQVLRLLAQNMTNLEIGLVLHISEKTVAYHIMNISDKIGRGNIPRAADMAGKNHAFEIWMIYRIANEKVVEGWGIHSS